MDTNTKQRATMILEGTIFGQGRAIMVQKMMVAVKFGSIVIVATKRSLDVLCLHNPFSLLYTIMRRVLIFHVVDDVKANHNRPHGQENGCPSENVFLVHVNQSLHQIFKFLDV